MNRGNNISRLVIAALVALIFSDNRTQARTSDGKPIMAPSIVTRPPDAVIDGPLLQRVKKAITAANHGDSRGFSEFFASDAKLNLSIWSGKINANPPGRLNSSTLTVEMLQQMFQATTKSCTGPWAYDEGATWVQFSWICRVDEASPLRKFLTFVHSPELSLTVWFKGDRIETVKGMEPFPVPGKPLAAMDAFCRAIAEGEKYPYRPNGCP